MTKVRRDLVAMLLGCLVLTPHTSHLHSSQLQDFRALDNLSSDNEELRGDQKSQISSTGYLEKTCTEPAYLNPHFIISTLSKF